MIVRDSCKKGLGLPSPFFTFWASLSKGPREVKSCGCGVGEALEREFIAQRLRSVSRVTVS